MNQIQTSMLLLAQQVAERQYVPSNESASTEQTSFRDMLEKKQTPTRSNAAADGSESPEVSDAPIDEEPATLVVEEDLELKEQMLFSALFVMQNQVIPADTTAVVHQVEETAPQAAVSMTHIVEAEHLASKLDQPVVTVENQAEPMQAESMQTQQAADTVNVELVEANETENLEFKPVQTDQQTDKSLEYSSDDNKPELVKELEVVQGETEVFQDMKAVPIKVGEVAESETTNLSVSVKDQVTDQVAKAMDRGETRITIQLDPQNLGQVDVELTLTKNGDLYVELRAENLGTRNLLEREMGSLQTLLMRETNQNVQIEVPHQQEGQQQNFDDGRQGQHHQNPQQEKREQSSNGADFLQQLRLGLVSLDGEAS